MVGNLSGVRGFQACLDSEPIGRIHWQRYCLKAYGIIEVRLPIIKLSGYWAIALVKAANRWDCAVPSESIVTAYLKPC